MTVVNVRDAFFGHGVVVSYSQHYLLGLSVRTRSKDNQ